MSYVKIRFARIYLDLKDLRKQDASKIVIDCGLYFCFDKIHVYIL